METPKKTVDTLCDYCGEEKAVLYCRADSAKLCLSCDQHVHSANALSKKHSRSLLCDNCSSEPVSMRCCSENLVLCQECDWDIHGNCNSVSSHHRQSIEGFSGLPSPLELALLWGFDLSDKPSENGYCRNEPLTLNPMESMVTMDSWICKSPVNLHDLIVPSGNVGLPAYLDVPCVQIPSLSKDQNPTCGKRKQLVFQQLMALLKHDLSNSDKVHGDLESPTNLDPDTPNGNFNSRNLEPPNSRDADLLDGSLQHTPFTSLLMYPHTTNFKDEHLIDEDGMWGCSVPDQANQTWDFSSMRVRENDDHTVLETGYGIHDAAFRMKTYNELVEGTSLGNTNCLEDLYDLNCSSTQDDISSSEFRLIPSQDQRTMDLKNKWHNNSTSMASKEQPPSGRTPTPLLRTSKASLPQSTTSSRASDSHANESSPLVKSDTWRTPLKVDSELLTKNRGNAMQRYMEKKKTRRYDKHIRYESRKARADTRKRVKGRFVKAAGGMGAEVGS
ncbi:zinc finger protein CONSTANS-LIKE 13 [Amborella trichopoda]|nr:zinc finger protein CONSTANS-LIKE 13 [Amborella trichopoda]|eukprot:XP_006844546.2 zinc finger protein CONSTANS-LIKE 13 [Amborella trichopoda]